MKSVMGGMAVWGTRGRGIAAPGLLLIIHMGSSATAWALQVLEASDHAELAAEISDTDVNRIALDGDRVSRVIQSPGGFTVEHDPVRGDLYLYPDTAAFGPERAPATLYLGTEQGFTYRLSLSVVSRDSAQILIRNAAVAAGSVGRTSPVAGEHRDEAVSLILAVARREPVAGYIILPTPDCVHDEPRTGFARGALAGSAIHRACVENARRGRGGCSAVRKPIRSERRGRVGVGARARAERRTDRRAR